LLLTVVSGALAATVLPTAALDQTCEETSASTDVPERLSTLAEKISARGDGWLHAGELMLHVAKLRSECIPERVEALRTAARYFSYAGDYRRASDASFEAGESGVWTGQITLAAEAFIDAATYALEAGDPSRARMAATHASRLSGSPFLSQMQRMTIRGRAHRLIERCGAGFVL
jgi:hypothetical protein